MHNAAWLDPVGGLAVSTLVIRAGWGNTGNALLELADVGIAEEMKASVSMAAHRALLESLVSSYGKTHPDALVGAIQGVKAGQNYAISIEVMVPDEWSVAETRRIEGHIRQTVGAEVRGVRRVRVRFVARSADQQRFADEFIGSDVSPRSSPEAETKSTTLEKVSANSGASKPR